MLVDAEEGFRWTAHVEAGVAIGDRVATRFVRFGDGLVPFCDRIDR